MGSRSIRAGMIWLVLGTFCSEGPETVMDFVERIGVVKLTDGRLRSAGLMSGIVTAAERRRRGSGAGRCAARKGSHEHIQTVGGGHAITIPMSD